MKRCYAKGDALDQKIIDHALAVRKKAYAPYSKFYVGAAVKSRSQEKVFTGCNVENVSFGATVCAERVAIFSMVAELGKQSLEKVVVATETSPPSLPCAMCLQVISEFSDRDCEIILVNDQREMKKYLLSELLPHAFKQDSLKK